MKTGVDYYDAADEKVSRVIAELSKEYGLGFIGSARIVSMCADRQDKVARQTESENGAARSCKRVPQGTTI